MNTNYKYKSLSDFKKAHPKEFSYLYRKSWLNKLCEEMGWTHKRTRRIDSWAFEECLNEALKHNSKSEWVKTSHGSYDAANKNNWMEQCIAHMEKKQTQPGYWTYELCKEEALKYNTISDWYKYERKSYSAAKRNNWFDELSKHMIRLRTITDWTLEICKEVALKYKTKTEWAKANTHSVKIAKLNNWFDECTKHMIEINKPHGYWQIKENCKEEALKYKTKKEWKLKGKSSYSTSVKNKWIDELSTHMEEYLKPPGYWTLERCLEHALNYKVKEHWKKGHPPSYQGAMVHGHYDECTKHMIQINKPPGYWTKEKCIKEARKYSTFKEWTKKSSSSLNAARINGWMSECSSHIIRTCKKQGYWQIKEHCIEEAKKYDKISEWSNKSSASYHSAKKNNWFDECTTHMIKTRQNRKSKGYWNNKERCIEDALKYKYKTEWSKNSGGAFSSAKKNNWYHECTKHMA